MDLYFYIQAKQVPLYKGFFVIILSNDSNAIKKIIPSFDKDEHLFSHAIFDNYNGKQGFFVIFNHNFKYAKITPGIIAHETHHICSFIANKRGIILDDNNDEPIAYLQEWLTDEVHKFINLKIK